MANVADIKPWFDDDITHMLASVYFAAGFKKSDLEDKRLIVYRTGFVKALASVAVARGLNPETFISPEDIQLLRKEQS